jgi:hypothetical protein
MFDNNKKEKIWYEPLPFTFCRSYGNSYMSIPSDIKINVKLKSLDELITYPKQNRKRKCNDTYGKDNRLKK